MTNWFGAIARKARTRGHRLAGIILAVVIASGPMVAVEAVTGSSPAGAATGTPVEVFDICSCTGPLAATAIQTGPTLQAWVSWVNAHGGLNGHPVTMSQSDDQSSPGVANTEVQNAIANHVAAIIDNSSVDTDWAPIATKAGVPIIGGLDSDISYNNLDTFTPGPTLNYGIAGQMIAVSHLTQHRNEGIFYCVEAAVCKSETDTASIVAPRYGVKVVYKAGVSFGAPNYTAQCLAASQTGADVLEVADAATVQEQAAEDCAKQGWHPVQVVSTTAASMASNPNFKGMISAQQDIPYFVHNNATKTYWAALDKYQPTLKSTANFGEQSILAWAMAVLLQDAITAAAPASGTTITPALVKNGLYNLPAGDNLGGIAPQAIHFTKGQYSNRSCWFYLSAKNGSFVWANNQKPLCAYLMKPGSTEGSTLLQPKQQYTQGEAPTQ